MIGRFERSAELSTHLAAIFMGIGVATLLIQMRFQIYTAWTWSLVFGGTWLTTGAVLLFADMRVYRQRRATASPSKQQSTATDSSQADTGSDSSTARR
ncbi:MAG: hypothetical protein ABEI86_06045 [Halobacteriaceae archaeon]